MKKEFKKSTTVSYTHLDVYKRQDPFGYTIALAENAAQNGVRYLFQNEVIHIEHRCV